MPSLPVSGSSILVTITVATQLFLIGCSSSSSGPSSGAAQLQTGRVEGGKIVNLKGMGGPNVADELVAAAYEIAAGPGFMYTRDFLDRALQLNPKHTSALYLRAMMDWTPLAEGIVTKGLPLASNADPDTNHVQRSNDAISRIPDGDYKKFITQNGNQIHNETQSQDFIAAIEASLLRTRAELQKISNLPDFTAPFFYYSGPEEKIVKDCAVTKIADGVFLIKDCPWKQSLSRQVSFADVKATNFMVAAYLTYSTILSSYQFDGSIQLFKDIKARVNNGEKISEQETIRLMKNQTQFLKLRSGHHLTDIIGFTNELTQAVEEAVRLQSRLCRNVRNQVNRPGYLIESGFCVTEEGREGASQLDKATRGPVPHQARGWNWNQRADGGWSPTTPAILMTTININPLLKGQVTDLKAFLPTGFNSCGAGTNISDVSLGGIFPNGDFVQVARLNAPGFLNPGPTCQ